ncbi:amphi-Trp domain-containing protein [Halorubrum sp. N11]|uniref:amphi-Trp domain-containing protein n=1 Tax=Halorubrum sp. N11 TaxID=3402276 RepID=UPI003EB7179D
MPEEQLFKTEEALSRTEIADEQQVAVPERPRFEVELERLTDSETGEQRYELEYEIRWTK